MSSLGEGYVEGVNYTYGLYPELNPLRLRSAFLNAGLLPPPTATACELGFGYGISTVTHAAASCTQWFGTDFNPAQTAFAQELTALSGANTRLFDQSFAEFCSRTDLPDFDFVGLHGVWSWVSDENRRIIVDFIRRKLKPGGVVYLSYNTQPGLSAFSPLQDLLSRHADWMGTPDQELSSRIDGALDFADGILAASPLYAQSNPQVADRLKAMRRADRTYVAHEYFNHNWFPTTFSCVAEWLAPAKLEYACSANYFTTVDAWNLSAQQQGILNGIRDVRFRETVRDVMVNQTFRKDYWVKGARRLSPLERTEALLRQRVQLIRPRGDVPRKVGGALGERALLDAVIDPILDAVADLQPKTLSQIELAVRDRGIPLPQLVDVVMTFIRTRSMAPVQEDSVIHAAKLQTDKLNAFIYDKARFGSEISLLASPVIGTGLEVGRIGQFFVHAISQGKRQASELAAHTLPIMRAQGIAILKQGMPLESHEESLAALTVQAGFFIEQQLPVLKALQII